jgi:hypothetical protein
MTCPDNCLYTEDMDNSFLYVLFPPDQSPGLLVPANFSLL